MVDDTAAFAVQTRLRRALLGGVSAFPLAFAVLAPHAAMAQSCPPEITGSVIGPISLSGDCTVASGAVVSGGDTGILNQSGSTASLTNSGTIIGNYDGVYNSGSNSQGTLTALSNSGTISGGYVGIQNGGTIGALSNSGSVSGEFTGVYNYGTIGTLSNSGFLTGEDEGIENGGTIGTLNNATGGGISGYTGVYNFGSIGSLTNSGSIAGEGGDGLVNFGAIGALSNSGSVTGAYYGIENYAAIGALTNSGTISSYYDEAIYNDGSIGALNNQAGGVITSNDSAIENNGFIGSLSNSGTIIGTDDNAIYNYGTISTLANLAGGIVSGNESGIESGGTIGTLTNSGTITGAEYDGIYSYGTIDTLANSGTVAGGTGGIYNDGTIGALSNSGVVAASGTSGIGIVNYGTIGALSNSGVIAAGGASGVGIYNGSTIGALSNSGTVSGGLYGIENSGGSSTGYGGGTIASLTNNGVISGSIAGIYNAAGSTPAAPGGTIASLTNNGVISAADTGIYNAGTIGALVNTGTITGGVNAIYSTGGGLGDVTNSGLISGNIDVTGQNLTIAGGTGSVFGTLAGGTISLDSGDTLEFASGNQILADDVNAGATGTVSNDGVLQIGTPSSPASVNVTGNFVQGAGGNLVVPVTPAQSSELNVSGNATLGGTLTYDFAPGTYTASRTYEVLSASSITGTFASTATENLPLGAATQTTYLTDPGVELNFTAPVIVSPANASIFSAQTEAVAENTQADMGLLLDQATEGGAGSGNAAAACAAAAETNPAGTSQNSAGSAAQLAGTLGNALCGAGGWIEATGSLMNASRSNGAPGFNADGGGFLAGIDRVIGAAETRLGFALGYDQTRLTAGGGTGSMGVVRVALYGAQPVGPVTLSGVISYGNASNDTTRNSGYGNMSEHYSANIYSGGAQASTNVQLGPLALVPAAGIRVAGLGGASFVENASGAAAAFAVSGATANYNSVQPFVSVSLSHQFVTGDNVAVSTHAKIGYEVQAGNTNVITLLTAQDGTQFHVAGNKLDPSDALVALGVAAGKNNWSVFANYGARVSGNWTAQTAQIGLQVRF